MLVSHCISSGNQNGMSYGDFLPISVSVSQGLKYLHENQPQILHLNLKPSNILLFGDGQAKICDYGFSKLRLVFYMILFLS